MFNWKEFKNAEFVVHCDTEEKANDFLKKCEEQGLVWTDGEKLTDNNNYDAEDQDTCYRCYGGEICYSTIDFYENRRIKIVKWESERDNMEDKVLKLCKGVINNSDDPDCRGIGCGECVFSRGDICTVVEKGCLEIAKKIAQEYIDRHETRKVRESPMVKTFTQVVTTIKKGEVWIDESRTRQLHKIYINEYGNITFEYIGVYSSKVTKYEDEEEGTVSYDLCVGATDEALYTLEKPLTLDDFEIGEEFAIKDMSGVFVKINVFNTIAIARQNEIGIIIYYTVEDLENNTFIKHK